MERFPLFPRVGFRDGWLYIVEGGRLARVHAWPGFEVEERGDRGTWEPRDLAFRDRLYEAVWPCLWRWWNPVKFQFSRGTWWQFGNRQQCFPWAMGECERVQTWMRYCRERFDAAVPPEIGRRLRWGLLMPIPCDWLSCLSLARSAPQILDLRAHDPLLAVALARHWEFPGVGREDWTGLKQRAGFRRRELLEWLGYRGSEPTVNALRRHRIRNVRKTQVARCVREFFEVIQDPFYGPELLRLQETQNELVSSLVNPAVRRWLDAERLRDILRANRRSSVLAAREIDEVGELIECELAEPSLAFLHERRRYLAKNADWSLDIFKDRPFPCWPTPIAAGIEPITSVKELIHEGREMGHCVGRSGYILAALRGELAAYRVLTPVRATLTLERLDTGWRVSELKGSRNTEVNIEHRVQIARAFPCVVNWE